MGGRYSRAARADRVRATTATNQAGQQGSCGRGYRKAPAGVACHTGQRAGKSVTCSVFAQTYSRPLGDVGLGRSGLQGRGGSTGFKGQRHRSADREDALDKKGFVLLPRSGVAERICGWLAIPQNCLRTMSDCSKCSPGCFSWSLPYSCCRRRTGAGCGEKFIHVLDLSHIIR